MRRLGLPLLLTAALLPTALAVVFGNQDWEAIRCAARCGHAVRSGEACCPVDGGGPALKTCPSDADGLLAATVTPGLPAVTAMLHAPSGFEFASAPDRVSLRSIHPTPPDHVPLRLS